MKKSVFKNILFNLFLSKLHIFEIIMNTSKNTIHYKYSCKKKLKAFCFRITFVIRYPKKLSTSIQVSLDR
jgi:hypothetical protein